MYAIRSYYGFANIVSMHQYFMDHGYYTYGGGKLWHAGSMGSESTDPAHWNNLYTEGTGSPGGNFYKFSWDEGGLFQWSAGEFDMNTQAGDTKLANHMAEFIAGYDKSVITSYSIHYTKLYDFEASKRFEQITIS